MENFPESEFLLGNRELTKLSFEDEDSDQEDHNKYSRYIQDALNYWESLNDPHQIIYQNLCSIKAFGDIFCNNFLEVYTSAKMEFTNLTDKHMWFSCKLNGTLAFPKSPIWDKGVKDTVRLTVILRPYETKMIQTKIAPKKFAYIATVRGLQLRIKLVDVKIAIAQLLQVYPTLTKID